MKRLAALAFASLFAVGCGGSSNNADMGSQDVTMAQGDLHYYVVNKLVVPPDHSFFAIDLNGDGRPDNALGNIIGALSQNGLDVQGAIDKAVTQGTVILLFSVQTTSFATADNVGVTVYLGKSQMNPDFGGMGMFAVDSSQSPGKFFGKFASGTFNSNNPVTTKNPVTITIKLPLIDGQPPVDLVLNGAQVKLTTTDMGMTFSNSDPMKAGGELHGSIKKSDIDNNIIPAVAMLLTQEVQVNCGLVDGGTSSADGGTAGMCTDTAKQIKSLFDTGGCTDTNGVMAMANDNVITTCEVQGNSIIQNVLAPDVQIFDSSGNYAPNKSNTTKDSLSLGLGFNAVGAAMFQ